MVNTNVMEEIIEDMSYKKFKEDVYKHLSDYKNEVLHVNADGVYKYRGKDYLKPYILPVTGDKIEVVKRYNQLESVRCCNPFLISKDLHRYAHHLNSSQLMCYNFFRPFVDVKEGNVIRPTKELIEILKNNGIDIEWSADAICDFEYIQDDEGTNFDFYLRSGKTEVFFEIKYTEYGFGTFKQSDEVNRHREKYENIYKNRIKNCPAIKDGIKFDDEFRKNYQLIRNVIRVNNKQSYSVFIYDERNNKVVSQFNQFKESYVICEYTGNIIGITWQKLVRNLDIEHINEFREKYLE